MSTSGLPFWRLWVQHDAANNLAELAVFLRMSVVIKGAGYERPLWGIKRTCLFALHMSAFGTKQTWASALHMSAFGGKADIARSSRHLPRKALM